MQTYAPCRFADIRTAASALLCCLTSLSAADAPKTSGEPKPLEIEYPQAHSIFQRDGKTGEIIIEGTCAGTPGPVEARFNNGPWTLIRSDSQPGKFTAALTGEVGQGTLDVRLKQAPDVTASVPLVSIGDIFVVAGQSNAAGWAAQAYEPLDGLPFELSLYKREASVAWEKLRHPASASGLGSPWPITMSLLCKDQRMPVGLITTAIGGAWLKQWLKPSGMHYPGMIETVRAATRGTMKVRAVLWFQGEADCNPSQEYAQLSFNGNHDQYLAALKQFVSDVHRDLKLDTVYVGSIGNLPHAIDASAYSTRDNMCQIRRALQDSWLDAQVSPGPVVYDVELASDSLHVHFNSPEEMLPLARRWAAAISAGTYKTGVGRGPVLQRAEPGRDGTTVVLTFDQELKISDFKGRPGAQAAGWSYLQDGSAAGDAGIASATVEKHTVLVRFKNAVNSTLRLSYGVDDDGAGKNILRGTTDLPAEPFYGIALTTK